MTRSGVCTLPVTMAVALLIGIAVPLAAGPITPPDFEEEWYTVMLQGQKCGFMQVTTRREGDEVLTRSFMKVEVARGEAKVEIAMDQNYRESVDGKPLGFKHVTNMGGMPVTVSGRIKDGRITLVTEQFGSRQEDAYDFDPEIKFAWGQYREQLEHGLKPGTTYRIKSYEPSLKVDAAIEMEFKVHEKEPVDVAGKMRRLSRVTGTLLLPMPIVSETWVDEKARPIVTTVDLGIMQFKIVLASKEAALKDAEPPELFLNTLVRVERRIGKSAEEVRLRLRLPPDSRMKLPDLPDTAMQTSRRISDYEAEVTIRRLDWGAIQKEKVAKTDPPDATLGQYLRASTTLDIKDRRIKRLARKAVKGCTSPAQKADALRKFVTDYVDDKNLNVAFATAAEVARSRKGDCTEHAVLLAALARAAGLPARGVTGIVEIPSGPLLPAHGSAFGFHMWTQVNIGGQWVDIDGALRQTNCDPTHIALAVMPLNEEGLLESVSAILPLLGRLEIEIVSVTDRSPKR